MTKRQSISLVVLLTVKLVLGVIDAGAQPMWQGHEPDFFSVVRFLVENGRLPERSDYAGSERSADLSQATQPPLFTYMALPIVALLDDGSPVPPGYNPSLICEGGVSDNYDYMLTTDYNLPPAGAAVAGYALRFMNLAFALGMMIVVYFTVREIAPNSHFTALIAAAFVGFEPRLFELEIFISNESLLLLISSINLLFAIRLVSRPTFRITDIVGLIITALLGPFTKTNGYVLVFSTGVVIAGLILYYMVTKPRSRATRTLLIGAGILLCGFAVLSAFNYFQYGNLFGRYENLFSKTMEQMDDLKTEKLTATIHDTYINYKGAFPIKHKKAMLLYVAVTLAGAFLFIPRLLWAAFRRNARRFSTDMVLVVYVMAAVTLVLVRGNVLTPDLAPDKTYAPVRYYVAGLPAFAIVLAFGWQTLSPAKLPDPFATRLGEKLTSFYSRALAWNWSGFLWALVWFVIVIWGVISNIRDYAVFESVSTSEFETLVARQDIIAVPVNPDLPSDVPQLRAYDYTVDSDGFLNLTAYIQIAKTPALNYAMRVGLQGSDGASSACEVLPYGGRYAVTGWEADQIVVVPMEIPNCASDGGEMLEGPLDVTWTWLPANADGDFVDSTTSMAQSFTLNVDLSRSDTCLSNLGVFDNTFQVIQYTGPGTAAVGSSYLPAVNWYVRNDIANTNLTRLYHMTHKDTGETYTCEGIPRLGNYPIRQWSRGEIIYFDQCGLQLPSDATPGEYIVSVGFVDSDTGQVLPLTADQENINAEGLLNVAEVIVR